eukprot:CAMPEP_0178990782 /NCGR_PEP_ID=MMETSP0795-20121207/5159_1 /TAXON_ID=88552 /ORGANISM="Amoebophrya sp., Strain Ameob2" /LENGTH=491 /DNA_ID=CAMNT_0020682409 /DNA_START=249 /DNA_END=1724 /DNA_ORIENTATION=+
MYPSGPTGPPPPDGSTSAPVEVGEVNFDSVDDGRIAEVGGKDVEVQLSGANAHDLQVGLSWDFGGGQAIDLDCSVLCCNKGGQILDVCFYNQQVCMNGAIVHSGDEKTGAASGFDESVKIDIDAMDPDVTILVFLLNAFKGGTLAQVDNAKVTILELGKAAPLAVCPVSMRKGDFTGMVLGFIYRLGGVGNPWKIRNVGRACNGRTFEESLPDVRQSLSISGILDATCANMIMSMDKKFDMQKGDFLEIPPDMFRDGSDLFVGLGWEMHPLKGGTVDLDASILLFDATGNLVDVVNYANLSFLQGTVRHNGDNLTGAGKGDDEKIDIDLDRLPPVVAQLFIVVNVYTGHASFSDVSDAYVRLCAAKNKHEFCRFSLVHQTVPSKCLIFARLFRGPVNGSWVFNTIGLGCDGSVANQPQVIAGCLASVNGFGHQNLPGQRQSRSGVRLYDPIPAPAYVVAQPVAAAQIVGPTAAGGRARPPPNSKGECCVVL